VSAAVAMPRPWQGRDRLSHRDVEVPVQGRRAGVKHPMRMAVRDHGGRKCCSTSVSCRVVPCCACEDGEMATSISLRQRSGHDDSVVAAQGEDRLERRPEGQKAGAWARACQGVGVRCWGPRVCA